MKISATQKHARMSPRKIRPYAKMVQGMNVLEAQNQLILAVGKAPGLILEVLKSAVANATNNVQIPASDLKVASILVNQGLV
ncbi:MAG: uL22 family ribosomal protein, partial [Patescibacteria group bacterium]